MSAARRRKVRIPVVSRLTLAWLGAFGVCVVIAGAVVYAAASGRGAARIALDVESVEFLARNEPLVDAGAPENANSPGLRLSAPDLRESDATPDAMAIREGEETDDAMTYAALDVLEEPEAFADEEAGGDIIITIAGGAQPQRATPVMTASLARPRIAIPDPSSDMLRSTPLGKVPKISPEGRKAFSVYARPAEIARNKAKVGLIVGGLGLNNAITERAIDELPPEVSLAFAPYAKDLEFWTKKARDAGHEVLIELPMEGYGGNQKALGAAALLTSRSAEENLQRLDWLLSRFGGYFAATNYMGAKFSAEPAALKPVLDKLRDAGVAYIDDTGAARTSAQSAAVAWTSVNRMIPPAPTERARSAVRQELAALEQIAARDGAALGKTYAYAATLDEIVDWAQSLENKSVVPAPASALLRTNAATR